MDNHAEVFAFVQAEYEMSAQYVSRWASVLVVVKPETVVSWPPRRFR
jgi:hypothetical protein